MNRRALNSRLTRLEALAPSKPKEVLIIGLAEDVPDNYTGEVILTGVPRPEDKLHRQFE